MAIRTKPNSNFSCPSFQLFTSSGEVHLDPSYYKYSLCSCDKGFYGYGNSCLPCMRGGLCKKAKKQFPSTAAGDDKLSKDNHLEIKMTIKKGYWPCCQGFGDVQRLIKCEMNEVFQTEVCSPSEDCQCRVAASPYKMQPKTICNSSCICRLGNTGRFCSQCISGYYKKGPGCTKCPTTRDFSLRDNNVFYTLLFIVRGVIDSFSVSQTGHIGCDDIPFCNVGVLGFLFRHPSVVFHFHLCHVHRGFDERKSKTAEFDRHHRFLFPVSGRHTFRGKNLASNGCTFKVKNNQRL